MIQANGNHQNGATNAPAQTTASRRIRASLTGKHVCPFCGAVTERAEGVCPRCTLENTPATRQATKSRIGPWYVYQTRNPSAPGMKFSTLVSLLKRGQVTARSIVRGPTTHQLWRFAATVRGISREFGVCYGCGEDIEIIAKVCPHCRRLQEPPANPDTLLEERESLVGAGSGMVASARAEPETFSADIILPVRPPDPLSAVRQPQPRPDETAPRTEPVKLRELVGLAPEAVVESDVPGQAVPAESVSFDESEISDAEQILSAEELAAAFNLSVGDLPPQRDGAVELSPEPRGARIGQWVMALLLIGAGATAFILIFKPHWTDRATDWTQRQYQQVRAALARPVQPPAASPASPDLQALEGVESPRPIPSEPADAVMTDVRKMGERDAIRVGVELKPGTDLVQAALATTEPSASPPSEPRAAVDSADPGTDRVVPTSAEAPKVQAIAPVAVTPSDPETARRMVRQWRADALTAESKHDYPLARELLEQIRQLPRNAWPTDLDILSRRVEKRLGDLNASNQ